MGTHDTATGYYTVGDDFMGFNRHNLLESIYSISTCQEFDILSQLNFGVRFFDLRLNIMDGHFTHGKFPLGQETSLGLRKFLEIIFNFLRLPGTFVICCFVKEDGEFFCAEVLECFDIIRKFGVHPLTRDTTEEDLRTKRLFVMSRDSAFDKLLGMTEVKGWPGNGTSTESDDFAIQDKYEEADRHRKEEEMNACRDLAISQQKIGINFASSVNVGIPTDFRGIFDYLTQKHCIYVANFVDDWVFKVFAEQPSYSNPYLFHAGAPYFNNRLDASTLHSSRREGHIVLNANNLYLCVRKDPGDGPRTVRLSAGNLSVGDCVNLGWKGDYDLGQGVEPSIAINDDNFGVVTLTNSNRDFFWSCVKLNPDGSILSYGPLEQDDGGCPPRISINKNYIVQVHQSSSNTGLWVKVGRLNYEGNGSIQWLTGDRYDEGQMPSISINNANQYVEVHKGDTGIWMSAGSIDDNGMHRGWGPTRVLTNAEYAEVCLLDGGEILLAVNCPNYVGKHYAVYLGQYIYLGPLCLKDVGRGELCSITSNFNAVIVSSIQDIEWKCWSYRRGGPWNALSTI